MIPAGVEVAPVVQRRAHARSQRVPEPVAARRHELVLDRWMIRSQAVDHLLAVDRVGALGDQMDPVAAIREQANRGLEVPQESEAGNGKEDLQGVVAGPYRLPPSHLQKGAYVSSAHTTTNYLERRS